MIFPSKFIIKCNTALVLLLMAGLNIISAQAPVRKGYGPATYSAERTGEFMRTWWLAGPFAVTPGNASPSAAQQHTSFLQDSVTADMRSGVVTPPARLAEQSRPWKLVRSASDIISIDSVFPSLDYSTAFAVAEIRASRDLRRVLAVGSDDGIRVWLNGKLVHDNWLPRGTVKDNDLVSLELKNGTNQLLIKVQDMQGGWSFVARLLDEKALMDQLNQAIASGNVDKTNLLLDAGADPNGANAPGISPVVMAKISGRDDMLRLLVSKSAKDVPVPPGPVLMDDEFASLNAGVRPGLALLVAKDGEVLYRKGFGYADLRERIKVIPETKFRIGSLTKQFTAAAILRLQQQHLLSVNDKLSKFIPDFPRGNEVTIHQLLTHTSGIHSYTNDEGFFDGVTKPVTEDSLVNRIKKFPYDFNPGERMLYNNSGYFLLGHIIAKVSGKSYSAYLKENFFDPLDMSNTGIYYTGIKLDNEAKGNTGQAGHYSPALNWDMSWAGGAGAIYSTIDDLLKWNSALYGGKVINESSLKAALTPATLNGGVSPSMQYGYGLGINKYRGLDVWSHSGGLHGFRTQLTYYPQERLTVVMVSNTDANEVMLDPNHIAEAWLWSKMDRQVSFTETTDRPVDLSLYTGRYDLAGAVVITIDEEKGHLYATLTGQSRYEIFPQGEHMFFWKVVPARIKFFPDAGGVMKEAILYQNGQEIKASRLKEQLILKLDSAVLDRYTGVYSLNATIDVAVTRTGQQLFAQATGESSVELKAISIDEFVITELNATVRFQQNGQEKSPFAKLDMNNKVIDMPQKK